MSNKYNSLDGILNSTFKLESRQIGDFCARPIEEAIDGFVDAYRALRTTTHRDGSVLTPVVDPETFDRFERQEHAIRAALFRAALPLRTH